SGFRDLYGPGGPEGYYRQHGDDYRNPHEPAVVAALDLAATTWSAAALGPDGIDFGRTLDLAAGSGEATLALLRHFPDMDVEAIDPFTDRLYRHRTGRPCLAASFEDIATGQIALPV